MKWKHAFEEGLGTLRNGIAVYQTGKQLYGIGRVVISMLL